MSPSGRLRCSDTPCRDWENGVGELPGRIAQNFLVAADNLIDVQLQPAESPSWRVIDTLMRGLLKLW